MSIFKSIGTKLKRVISLNNLTRAATGQFTAIGSDVIRVATTKSPAEIKLASKSTEQVMQPFEMSAQVKTVLDAKGTTFKDAVSSKLAANPTVQNVSDMFTMTYLKSMWIEKRNWIIGAFVFVVLAIVGWKVFKKPSAKRATRRR